MYKSILHRLDDMDRLLLRPEEVAATLSISRAFAYQLIASGQLPSIRLGHAVRVPKADLEDWLRENRSVPLTPLAKSLPPQKRGGRQ